MKLFYSPGACSLAPHILLRETGTPFTLVKADLGQHQTQEGSNYYELNPKGQVPLLELDDGTTLSEGPVIAQFIAEQAGQQELLPPVGSLARYKVLEWQNYITSELHTRHEGQVCHSDTGPTMPNTVTCSLHVNSASMHRLSIFCTVPAMNAFAARLGAKAEIVSEWQT